jgi:vacuolar-type H+-ATPase subunit I/STV1
VTKAAIQLTPETYEQKRTELGRSFATARADCDRAELDYLSGTITEAERDQARERVITIEAQRRGLDSAYREVERLSRAADATRQRQKVAADRKATEEAEVAREDAFRKIVEGIEELAPHVQQYRDALEAVGIHGRGCTADVAAFADLKEEANSVRREADLLNAVMFNVGLNLFGLGRGDAAMRCRDAGLDVETLNAQRSKGILRHLIYPNQEVEP